MVSVIWPEVAIEDLSSIHKYISRDSEFYADRFVEKVMNRVSQLESFPKSGRVVPEFNSEIIRELIEASYRIIYKIISYNSVANIRVHHAARQLK